MTRPLRFAIAFDATPPGPQRGGARDALAKGGVIESVEAFESALRARGHEAHRLPVTWPVRSTLRVLEALAPDAVVNLCEGLRDDASYESHVAALFELWGVPYTGAPPEALALALRKPLANAVLSAHGIPVPAGAEVLDAASAPRVVEKSGAAPPWIVKPSREDASIGIDAGSVVRTAAALRKRVAWIMDRHRQPALVESYIEGREFNVAVVGDGEVLPISELDFGRMPAGHPRMLTYEAKWTTGSAADRGSVPVCPARVDGPLARRLGELARAAVAIIGGRDVSRVDFRVDDRGRAFVLEVNPNPDVSPSAGVARQVAARGWRYDDFVIGMCEAAANRCDVTLRNGKVNDHVSSRDDSRRSPVLRRSAAGRAGGSPVSEVAPRAGLELLVGGTAGGGRGRPGRAGGR